jgi:hypothetical protein
VTMCIARLLLWVLVSCALAAPSSAAERTAPASVSPTHSNAGGVVLDYAWWKTASDASRVAAVRSGILAGQLSWMIAYATARVDSSNALAKVNAPDRLVSAVDLSPIREAPAYARSLPYYVRAVGAFYAGHPRARAHEVAEVVLFCLPEKPMADDCGRLSK